MADKITMSTEGVLNVSDNPIIPFIEGDGIGVDIWPASKLVLDAAAKKYGKVIEWKEVLAGQKAFDETGEWLPEQTVADFREYLIGIKGPLTTPIGEGFRSLNVALRQILDLYVCLRPVRWFQGVPSPVKHPEMVDMVIFRENTEDVYAGLEVEAGTPDAEKLRTFLRENYGWNIREMSGIGIKPISKECSERLIRASINYALSHQRESVTLVHKGNIQKFTEFGELLDVALVHEGDRLSLMGQRIVDRGANQALGALLRDWLDADAAHLSDVPAVVLPQ